MMLLGKSTDGCDKVGLSTTSLRKPRSFTICKRLSLWIVLALILVTVLTLGQATPNKKTQTSVQSLSELQLTMLSGEHYVPSQPTILKFAIVDQHGKTFTDFDTNDDYRVQLIVIRKDRTNFQHVHPIFNEADGTFTMNNFKFPADGSYRVYAVFSPREAAKGVASEKLTIAPFHDVSVGDASVNAAQPDTEKLEDTADGFTTRLIFPPEDSSGAGSANFVAGAISIINISVSRGGAAYKNLEAYKSSLGRLAAIGPNLELAVVNADPTDTTRQTGAIPFTIKFPSPGIYKLFLQTNAGGTFTTTEFSVDVKPSPRQVKNTKS